MNKNPLIGVAGGKTKCRLGRSLVTHTYPEPGTYTVTLTVKDAAGNTDMDIVAVTIFPPPLPPLTIPWWIVSTSSVEA